MGSKEIKYYKSLEREENYPSCSNRGRGHFNYAYKNG